MTPTQVTELLQDFSFENWLLDEALLVHPNLFPNRIDLRGSRARIEFSTTSNFAEDVVESFRDKLLLPLLFGTAWKILDLVVERAWQARGGPSKPSINGKAQWSISGLADLASLIGCDASIGDRVFGTYRATLELRHALVHRRISRNDGGLIVQSGQFLTRGEILAFCKLARRITVSVRHRPY